MTRLTPVEDAPSSQDAGGRFEKIEAFVTMRPASNLEFSADEMRRMAGAGAVDRNQPRLTA